MTPPTPKGRVLIVAGSDSGGGAGIQADIKAVTALGGFAMTAVTAITVQNTLGVFNVHPIPLAVISEQISCVTSDLGVDAVKTGMLGSIETVETVAEALETHTKGIVRVVDPVMVAKGGHPLLEERAVAAVKSLMIPLAGLLTPNAPEAERLTDLDVDGINGQRRAGERLLRLGAEAVLVKGGHIPGPRFTDVLATQAGEVFFEAERIETASTHGTGCTLASAIAAYLAQGVGLEEAVERARAYLLEAIRRAPGFGKGHGPLNHAWTVSK
ncbi:hydroxymethylpyrimidine/phosphomethylpyrimidine kinase [Candidatus Phycosocius bacilliformis]|uniref:hydroxymethylpyrimidine kinase n=1 Tax=Candidatus Phycosocius bacilliformis TaxID=1445552 RepID=A0A2P2EBW9_9PROT|nr:bifunctional hydroxymethylpyrimidine kinase/phosphomethylpyrimidine kinase [Candidatus Phycosocius bacilliformis]GBF58565.1 hydroxymethylpyrimidine/phosphomethylpyrimidine kinase [Candidatus Phycosocius bacilliformis]